LIIHTEIIKIRLLILLYISYFNPRLGVLMLLKFLTISLMRNRNKNKPQNIKLKITV